MSKQILLNISLIISMFGILTLYLIYANTNLGFIDINSINDESIGKTIKSKATVSSIANYEDNTIIYTKEGIKLIVAKNISVNDSIEFKGKVNEDEYGIVIYVDNLIN